MCTMPENFPEFAQSCVNGTIRRGAKRLDLQSRIGLGIVCIDCGFSYFNSPSSLLQFDVPLASVQHLHNAGIYHRICANLRKPHYTAWRNEAWFAGPYRFGHRLHRLRVSIFQLPIFFALVSCAPYISATSAPCRQTPPYLRRFALSALYGVEQIRLGLQSRTGFGTVYTDCRFPYFNSTSSLLYVHVHLLLVQHVYRA